MSINKLFTPDQIDEIKRIVALSANECFGVVAMSSKNTADGIITMFKKDNSYRGVKLSSDEEGRLTVSLYVVTQYGVRTSAVAENLIDTVKYSVEKQTPYKVKKVEVNVVALRN